MISEYRVNVYVQAKGQFNGNIDKKYDHHVDCYKLATWNRFIPRCVQMSTITGIIGTCKVNC